VTKYPPSLDYVFATFTVLLLLFALFDKALEERWATRALGAIEIYGRVPFFYYVIHFYLLHIAMLVTMMVVTGTIHIHPPVPILEPGIPAATFSLPVVYGIWMTLVALLYLPCKWFAGVKARRRDWWLSYL
jgi:predicted acyltransferase